MAVLIDIDMPDSCRECMFCKYDSYNGSTECAVDGLVLARHFKTIEFEGRAEDCPLKEVINCVECKHWYSDADTGMACEFTNMSQPEDGYCNWGEKKE